MAIRDYWVYQKRDAEKPWAFYIVKEFDKMAGSRATCLDVTFYHEDIQNALHAVSEICIHYATLSEYVNHLLNIIRSYSNVTLQDERQLTEEVGNILAS